MGCAHWLFFCQNITFEIEALVVCSGFVLADISYRSLQKLFIYIIQNEICIRSERPENMQFNFNTNVTKSESPSIWVFEVSISIEVVVDLWKDSFECWILVQFVLIDKGFIACKELHRKFLLRVPPFCKTNDALTCTPKLEVRM